MRTIRQGDFLGDGDAVIGNGQRADFPTQSLTSNYSISGRFNHYLTISKPEG
jgi:hypothetical protein